MLKIIGLVLLVAIVVVLIIAARRPDRFVIARTARMKAPPDKIFPYLSDLKRNQDWSPFEKTDPNMQRSYSAPSVGPGATYEFAGNNQAGAGRITILENVPSSKVVMRLEMSKPMKADNTVTYDLAPMGGETEVTWRMEGKQPFPIRVMCVFFNMDKMMGKVFDTGLSTLKAIVEK